MHRRWDLKNRLNYLGRRSLRNFQPFVWGISRVVSLCIASIAIKLWKTTSRFHFCVRWFGNPPALISMHAASKMGQFVKLKIGRKTILAIRFLHDPKSGTAFYALFRASTFGATIKNVLSGWWWKSCALLQFSPSRLSSTPLHCNLSSTIIKFD